MRKRIVYKEEGEGGGGGELMEYNGVCRIAIFIDVRLDTPRS